MKKYEVRKISENWYGIYDVVKHEMVIESTSYGIKFYESLFC